MNDRLNKPSGPPELFAERPISSDFARLNSVRHGPPYVVRRCITIFVICAIIGGGLYWRMGKPAPIVPEEIPTIKADGSYKQRPQQPGGIDIPHQDVQVYQELDNKSAPPTQVEHLLPPPETPQSTVVAPQSAIIPNADAVTPQAEILSPPPAPKIETTATPATVTAAPVPAPAPAAAPVQSAPVSAPIANVAPAAVAPAPVAAPKKAAVIVKPTPAPAEPSLDQVIKDVTANDSSSPAPAVAPTATTTGGNSAIQLASIPDQAAAQSAMSKLQSQYASALGGTQLRVVKADLGAKGIYYRIQSQPVTEAQAKTMCATIRATNAGCLIVRP